MVAGWLVVGVGFNACGADHITLTSPRGITHNAGQR